MESQSSQSPPPDAKPGTPPAAASGGVVPQAIRHTYPKPPPLLMRLLLLCLRPESWAEAAQYPTWVTLVPLFLVVVVGALAMGTSETWRTYESARNFAAAYDTQSYPALEINSEGVLSAKGPLEQPIRFNLHNSPVLVDPTGKITAQTVGMPCLFVSDNQVSVVGSSGPMWAMPLQTLLQLYGVDLPPEGQTKTVSKESLLHFLDRQGLVYAGAGMVLAVLLRAVGETLWVLMMIFMLCPLIVIAAAGPRDDPDAPHRRLILPKRAAYRMAAGLLVPLTVLGALLRTIGHPVENLLGPDKTMLFWVVAATCLAAWTGLLAKKMYGRKERRA
jgi:hypothetical protein